MKIIDSIGRNKKFISFEFFPPKTREAWPVFFNTVQSLAKLNPLFASVTYGAGGSAHAESLEIVTKLQQEYGLKTMAHLTCVGSKLEEITDFLNDLAMAGVTNVLALRGDLPVDGNPVTLHDSPLKYASDLVTFIRATFPEMGIGVAGYPEVHPESENSQADLSFLQMKLNSGADFAITQLFFDNTQYHNFVKRAREVGVTKPIIPGILPVVSLKVIKRIVSLCGACIPAEFLDELEKADRAGGAAAVQKIGVAHARRQTQELLDAGVPGVHIYTLNRAEVVLELLDGLVVL